MILQPLPNFKHKFSPKEEVVCYDNIALNQRIVVLKAYRMPVLAFTTAKTCKTYPSFLERKIKLFIVL